MEQTTQHDKTSQIQNDEKFNISYRQSQLSNEERPEPELILKVKTVNPYINV